MSYDIKHGKKTPIETVKAFIEEKGGRLISKKYINMLTRIEVSCDKGHTWTTTFNHIKNRKQWCNQCYLKKIKENPLKMSEEAKKKISNGHFRRMGYTNEEDKKERAKVKKKINNKRRYKYDKAFKIKINIRSRLCRAIHGKRKILSVTSSLQCSWTFFRKYLESKFQPGMSWDNYGLMGWHIDHIKPLSSFDLEDPEQFKQACHYTNLQPLWAKDNLVKSNKIGEEYGNELDAKIN